MRTADETVRLEVPARTEHLRLVRLVVAGMASSHGADVDDLEDLRIATGELCAHLVDRAAPEDRLVADVTAGSDDGGAAVVTVEVSVPGAADAPLDELAAMLLDTTTDRCAAGPRTPDGAAAGATLWFERRLRASDGAVDASADA